MGRHRSPTALHEVTGAFVRNPQRRNQRETKPEAGIGPAPQSLSEAEQTLWDELVGIVPPGVLGDSDRWLVERAVKLMYIARYDEDRMTGAREGHLISCLARMGMTPSDRAKITIPDQGDSDPDDEFF